MPAAYVSIAAAVCTASSACARQAWQNETSGSRQVTRTVMQADREAGGNQATLWNSESGRAWVELQELLDEQYQPFADLLVEGISDGSVHRVLDIGCGTGTTTLAAA